MRTAQKLFINVVSSVEVEQPTSTRFLSEVLSGSYRICWVRRAWSEIKKITVSGRSTAVSTRLLYNMRRMRGLFRDLL